MAKPKKVTKPVKKISPLRGTRQAESIGRQVERKMTDKWPLDKTTAGEWLIFAACLKAKAQLIEADALRIVNPGAFAQTRADIIRGKQQNANVKSEEDNDE